MIRLALYQPEIPHNTGTLMRLATCLNIGLDIIHPCGFVLSDAHLRRAGMDYIERTCITQYNHYGHYQAWIKQKNLRVIMVTPGSYQPYIDFVFHHDDIILMGQESKGFPDEIKQDHRHKVQIPMHHHERSLNMAIAASMVVGEALRQTRQFPNALNQDFKQLYD